MNTRLVSLLLALLCACTTVNYESPKFAVRARHHETIAVLPFEVIFTGKAPAALSGEQIAQIEEAESLAFQWALYNSLLDRSSVRRERRIDVDIQPVETTNLVLSENGIGIRESWHLTAQDLAQTLGVDAVVRTAVQKNRYLSDLASYGVDVGLHVLHDLSDGAIDWPVPWGLTTTHDIYADSTLVSGEDGYLLWKVAVHRSTDWHRPANDVVAGITRKLAKKFPYRG